MPPSVSYVSFRISKKKLLKKLQPFRRKEFAKYLNPIIAENRGIPLARAKHVKSLQSVEVKALLEKIGEPEKGYGREIHLEKTRMTRHELEIKVPYVSRNLLQRIIIAIVMQSRGIPFQEARNKKTLQTNEVLAFLTEIGEDVPKDVIQVSTRV